MEGHEFAPARASAVGVLSGLESVLSSEQSSDAVGMLYGGAQLVSELDGSHYSALDGFAADLGAVTGLASDDQWEQVSSGLDLAGDIGSVPGSSMGAASGLVDGVGNLADLDDALAQGDYGAITTGAATLAGFAGAEAMASSLGGFAPYAGLYTSMSSGDTLGTAIGAVSMAFPAVGAGLAVGGALGMFSSDPPPPPEAEATLAVDGEGHFHVASATDAHGGNAGSMSVAAQRAADTINELIEATGGRLLQPGALESIEIGYDGDGVYAGDRHFDSISDAIAHVIEHNLAETPIEGGDVFVKRALYRGLEDGFDPADMAQALETAQAYSRYQAGAAEIERLADAEGVADELAEFEAGGLVRNDLGAEASLVLDARETTAAAETLGLDRAHAFDDASRLNRALESAGVDLNGVEVTDLLIANLHGELVLAVKDPAQPGAAIRDLPHASVNAYASDFDSAMLYLPDGGDWNLSALIELAGVEPGGGAVDVEDALLERYAAEGESLVMGASAGATLTGTAADEALVGWQGSDVLRGGAGDDRLVGGAGHDTLEGGAGDDTADYSASASGVAVDLADGAGRGGEAEGDTLRDIEHVAGSTHGDQLAGDGAANVLDGESGDDVLLGRAGDDELRGGRGDDHLEGGGGNDVLAGHTGDDTALGGAGSDRLSGGAGADRLDGGEGDDLVLAGSGDDVADGGAGRDTVFAGAGDDVLLGQGDGDTLVGGTGRDTVVYGRDLADYRVEVIDGSLHVAHGAHDGPGDRLVGVEMLQFGDRAVSVETMREYLSILDQADEEERQRRLTGVAPSGATAVGDAAAIGLVAAFAAPAIAAQQERATLESVERDGRDDVPTTIPDPPSTNVDQGLFAEAPTGARHGLETGRPGGRGGDGGGTPPHAPAPGEGHDASGAAIPLGQPLPLQAFTIPDLVADTGAEPTVAPAESGPTEALARMPGAPGEEDREAQYFLTGTPGDDEIIDTGDLDGMTISGLAGDDLIVAQAGDDLVLAGPGDDVILPGVGEDQVFGDAGEDTVSYRDADGGIELDLELQGGTGGVALGDVYEGIEAAEGSGFDDRMYATSGATSPLYGLAGDDALIGREADDLLDGGTGADVIEGAAGDDEIHGGAGADRLDGGAGADRVRGGDGGDRIDGGPGADRLFGDAGEDRLEGGAGDDELDGGTGADWLHGGGGADRLRGGAGANELHGGEGDDWLEGGMDRDFLAGDAGADRLFGFGGADVLAGGAGADELAGGAGDDELVGGAGADTFIAGAGDDRIVVDAEDDLAFIDGGTGVDTVELETGFAGEVDLTALDTGSTGADDGIERVLGSAADDRLRGTVALEDITGAEGFDVVRLDHAIGDFARLDADTGELAGWSWLDDGGLRLTHTDGAGVAIDVEEIRFNDRDVFLDGRDNAPIVAGETFGGREDRLLRLDDHDLIGNDFDLDAGESVELVGAGGIDVALTRGLGGSYRNAHPAPAIDPAPGNAFETGFELVTESIPRGGEVTRARFQTTFDGGDGDDVLFGTREFDDVVDRGADGTFVDAGAPHGLVEVVNPEAASGDDLIRGRGGDDLLVGGEGADRLLGGSGSDTADYSRSSDAVEVDLERGTGAFGTAAGDRLSGIENVIGSAGDDRLSGDGRDNVLQGGAGQDRLAGGGGDDVLIGGAGDWDAAVFSGRREEYEITAAADHLVVTHRDGGSDGIDRVYGVQALEFADDNVFIGHARAGHGELSVTASGIEFDPKADFNSLGGAFAGFDYEVGRAGGATASTTARIDIAAVNDAPFLAPGQVDYDGTVQTARYPVDTDRGTSFVDYYQIDATGQVLGRDLEDGGNLGYRILEQPEHGHVELDPGTGALRYRLNVGDDDAVVTTEEVETCLPRRGCVTETVHNVILPADDGITPDEAESDRFRVEITDRGEGESPERSIERWIDLDSDFPSDDDCGIFPVALDLDGDGLDFSSIDDSDVVADVNGDGSEERVAWIGDGDALLLLDRDADGQFSDFDEISFVEDHPAAHTDMEGLALAFDTSGDGRLDPADARWDEFRLWRDVDGDGRSDSGELVGLDSIGIVSIGVVSDGNAATAAGGDVSIFGESRFSWEHGGTGVAGDVALGYAPAGAGVAPSNDEMAAMMVQRMVQAESTATPSGTDVTVTPVDEMAIAAMMAESEELEIASIAG